ATPAPTAPFQKCQPERCEEPALSLPKGRQYLWRHNRPGAPSFATQRVGCNPPTSRPSRSSEARLRGSSGLRPAEFDSCDKQAGFSPGPFNAPPTNPKLTKE